MSGIRRFLRVLSSRRGVIGLMFGLVWGPMIGWSFMAIALSLKAANQYAAEASLDSALIAAAATPVTDLPSGDNVTTDRQLIVNAYWKANGGPTSCGNTATVSVPAESANNTLTASIQCQSAIGQTSNLYVATSTVQLQGAVIEVAMVLDNTGSMQQNNSSTNTNSSSTVPSKMSGLKVGAFKFLNGLAPYATAAGQIKVAIVPMTTDINIGNTTTTEAMVKYNSNADAGILAGVYANVTHNGHTSCTQQSYTVQAIVNGSTYDNADGTKTTTACGATVSSFTAYTIPSTGITNATWLGCVVDRDALISGVAYPSTNTSGTDYEASNALPTANSPYSLYPADNINCGGTSNGPVPLVALTDLYVCKTTPSSCVTANSSIGLNALPQSLMNLLYCRSFGSDSYCSNYVSTASTTTPAVAALTQYGGSYTASNSGAMIANGDTDLPIGLAWGWNMLTPNFPLSPNASTSSISAAVDKVIVFFTDGYNTQDRYNLSSSNGDTAQTHMDTETTAMCNAIKADTLDPYNSSNKITIFTVKTADAAPLVDTCATNSNDAFTISSPAGIDSALQSILSKITALRVNQ